MSSARLGDIVVYGGSSWDEPWLTEHHLARALSRSNRVLFVDSPKTVVSSLRNGVQLRSLRAIGGLAGNRLRRVENVDVLGLVTLPPASGARARELSGPWLRHQVTTALRRLGMRPRVVVAARGVREGIAAEPAPFTVALVKDWLQAGGHLTGLDAAALRTRELAAWRAADLVCAVSGPLQARLAEDGIESVLLRHGFDAGMAARYDAVAPVPAYAELPRPLLGCVGRIDARWSFDALAALAERFSRGSVLLLGPVNRRLGRERLDALVRLANVHLLPAVSAGELPGRLAGLDCCLVPYLDDEWQRFASPLKVWDYLFAGPPIAATGAPALGRFPPGLIHFGLEPGRLGDLVATALAEDSAQARAARRRYALENTWEHRAEQLAELVGARMPGGVPALA